MSIKHTDFLQGSANCTQCMNDRTRSSQSIEGCHGGNEDGFSDEESYSPFPAPLRTPECGTCTSAPSCVYPSPVARFWLHALFIPPGAFSSTRNIPAPYVQRRAALHSNWWRRRWMERETHGEMNNDASMGK